MAAAADRFDRPDARLCLGFANGASRRPGERTSDRFRSYAEFLAWAESEGLVAKEETPALAREAAARPGRARAVLRRAAALREALYRLCVAVATGAVPAGEDLSVLERELAVSAGRRRLVRGPGGFRWAWAPKAGDIDRMLWPIAASAEHLLTSDELPRLRACAADDCVWLFLDLSRNRSRVWCDMQVCGNRAKARRHYERSRKERKARA